MDNRLENNKKVNPFYEEYWKLKEDDNIEDIVEFIAHSKICRYGHGAEEGEEDRIIDDEQEIVELYANTPYEDKGFLAKAVQQGYELLARAPFPWKGLAQASRIGKTEVEIKVWLQRQLKLLEAEGRKRGWIK